MAGHGDEAGCVGKPSPRKDSGITAAALERRTSKAIELTGISREDGEWRQVGRVMPGKQNSAEYKKGTDGNWYRWSEKSTKTSILGQTVSDISETMDTAFEGVLSQVQSIYK